MTVRVAFSDLWTHGDERGERLGLDALERHGELGHVHGTLVLEIDGHRVPRLGFFGPDDVCFDTWLVELCNAVNEIDDEHMSLSIAASAISGADAEPDWQNVPCRLADFVEAVTRFTRELQDELRRRAPTAWQRWWPLEPAGDA